MSIEETEQEAPWVSPDVKVHESVVLGSGSRVGHGCYLSENVVIGPEVTITHSHLYNATVEQGTIVDGSVLWGGVTVGIEATIRNSSVDSNASIGDYVTLDGAEVGRCSVIGSRLVLPYGAHLPPGSDIRCDSDVAVSPPVGTGRRMTLARVHRPVKGLYSSEGTRWAVQAGCVLFEGSTPQEVCDKVRWNIDRVGGPDEWAWEGSELDTYRAEVHRELDNMLQKVEN